LRVARAYQHRLVGGYALETSAIIGFLGHPRVPLFVCSLAAAWRSLFTVQHPDLGLAACIGVDTSGFGRIVPGLQHDENEIVARQDLSDKAVGPAERSFGELGVPAGGAGDSA
jgi:hypothetical protein